jgi:hypothetical protein
MPHVRRTRQALLKLFFPRQEGLRSPGCVNLGATRSQFAGVCAFVLSAIRAGNSKLSYPFLLALVGGVLTMTNLGFHLLTSLGAPEYAVTVVWQPTREIRSLVECVVVRCAQQWVQSISISRNLSGFNAGLPLVPRLREYFGRLSASRKVKHHFVPGL